MVRLMLVAITVLCGGNTALLQSWSRPAPRVATRIRVLRTAPARCAIVAHDPSPHRINIRLSLEVAVSRRYRALRSWAQRVTARLTDFSLGLIPIDWIIRRCVQWLAFDASAKQCEYVIALCEGAAPIAQSAKQAATLRELYARACADGVCTPELQAEALEVRRFIESATEQALAGMIGALDEDGDGRVTLAEALATWKAVAAAVGASSDASAKQMAAKQMAVPAVTLLEAMRRAKSTIDELERLKFGVELAVEGAVAAVDADGDGKLTVEEVVMAPGRIAAWFGVWRDLIARGKL